MKHAIAAKVIAALSLASQAILGVEADCVSSIVKRGDRCTSISVLSSDSKQMK